MQIRNMQIRIIRAIFIDGVSYEPGAMVDVAEQTGRDLTGWGCAEIAPEAESETKSVSDNKSDNKSDRKRR